MNNIEVIRAFKLVDDINIDLKKYNPTKIFINSNSSKAFFNENISQSKMTTLNIDFIYQNKENNCRIVNQCKLYINSKFTQVIRQTKSMTLIINKF